MRPDLLLALLLATAASTPIAQDDTALEPAEQLQGFLGARDGNEQAIVSDESRVYLDSLPEHARKLLLAAIDTGMIATPDHLQVLLSLQLDTLAVELVLRDNCVLCHTNAEENSEETLFSLDPEALGSPPHFDLREALSDSHFRQGLSCSGCHGGSPSNTDMVDEIYERWPTSRERGADRSWIPAFCARCHDDPTFMRRFNPSLPTDQYAKYRASQHGTKLLQEGDSKAAQCVSCHGTHGIRSAESPRSKVHPQRIPETCGKCHADPEYMQGYKLEDGSPLPTDQLARYVESVHGRALLERGDLGAPACNDCHGNHAARPPEVASVGHVCRTCHTEIGELFDGSKHKASFAEHDWPECGRCHGNHAILEASDEMLGSTSGTVCFDCHAEFAEHNPECAETAAHFRTSIDGLFAANVEFEESIERLAEDGLDVDALAAANSEIRDSLRLSRSRIHSFNRSDFDQALGPGREAMAKGHELVEAAHAEFRFRRTGLVITMAMLATLALLLYLKLRQIEGREPEVGD